VLKDAIERAGYDCGIKPAEAAFYAPKVEFDFFDAIGRRWTLGTVQWDMGLPGRFELEFVGPDNQPHRPEMLHRAILGSLERFLGIYIEHTAGDFPLWLAPVQAVVLPVSEKQEVAAAKVCDTLRDGGVRAETDLRNETLGYRVRGAEVGKVPYVLVVGDREAADGTVSVRKRHSKGQETIGVDAFRSTLEEEIRTRGIS
jgi:threonyl-tRNA synthetase